MPIVRITSSDKEGNPNVEVLHNYSGHESNRIFHDFDCPNYQNTEGIFQILEDCRDRCHAMGPLYMETTHEGVVLSLRTRNWVDDTDYMAEVWDDTSGEPKEIEYASTRGWTYPNYAIVDATLEVLEKYAEWQEKQRKEAEEAEKRVVRVGRRVRIMKGKHKGQEGLVTWQGANQFRTYYKNGYNRPEAAHNQRIRVAPSEGEPFFTEYLYAEVII